MFNNFMEKIINNPYTQKREKYIVEQLEKYIENNKKVLDIGCGSGIVSSKLKKRKNLNLIGVDKHKKTDLIPFMEMDGKKLLFKKNHFDYSLLADVLHHDKDIKNLLKEASRVSKKVIIKDHFFETKLQYMVLSFMDFLCNINNIKSLKYNFLTLKEWKKLFKTLNLRIIEFDDSSKLNKFDIIKHVFFVVEKQ